MRPRSSFGSGYGTPTSFGGGDVFGRPPRDVLAILVVLFVTFVLQSFETTRILPALLELTPAVWRYGFLWQLATYGFVASAGGGAWLLLSGFMIYLFGRDVYGALGRRRFWKLLLVALVVAGAAASLVHLLLTLGRFHALAAYPFALMDGQDVLFVVLISAFATLYGHATILLFFVLPIQARWFLPITLFGAFLSFLDTKDLAGFVGLVVAVGVTWTLLGGRSRGSRGVLREGRLRLERWWLERRLRRMGGGRGGGRGGDGGRGPIRGPWVH